MSDYGKILEVLNNKADRDLRNIDVRDTDTVIEYQEPTSANNYTWYRLYASGWVEQGGQYTNTSRLTTINLPITMANNGYTINLTQLADSGYTSSTSIGVQSGSITTTRFQALNWYANSYTTALNWWQVSGKADMTGHPIPVSTQIKEEFEHRVIAFQAPTSANGYKWYRKYADGWVEQGGKDWLENNTITFPVTMADTNYYVSCGGFVIANHGRQLVTKYVDKITSSSDGQTCGMSGWLVMGMAA